MKKLLSVIIQFQVKLSLVIAIIVGSSFATQCSAQDTDVVDFNYGSFPQGQSPYGNVLCVGSKLYGMAQDGGAFGEGCIFSVDSTGNNYKDMLDFSGVNGAYPLGGFVLSGKTLYAMTQSGGVNGLGNIFKIDTNGANYTDLLDFGFSTPVGLFPLGSLTLVGKRLYGMTVEGGESFYYEGNVFAVDTTGANYTDLHDFSGWPDGAYPYASLLYTGGNLYGMTNSYGANYDGMAFKIDTDGSGYTDIHDFNYSDGDAPEFNSFISAGDKLFGMTPNGGGFGDGLAFSMFTDGSGFTDLHDFSGGDGATPYGDLTLVGNTLYGMTNSGGANGYGDVFKMDTLGNNFVDTLDFSYSNGANPYGSVRFSGDFMYGMTSSGGLNGAGNVFRLYLKLPMQITTSDTNVSCNGGSNGQATAYVQGGTPPYTYTWSPGGATTSSVTGLSASTYTVYVHDADNALDTSVVDITQPPLLMASAVATANVTCNGGSNGIATSTTSGGTTPYTYAWTGGGTNNAIVGLTAGTYTLNVTDVNGCSSSSTIAITQPNPIIVTLNTTANVTCRGAFNGSASSMITGGSAPFTYAWTGGAGHTDTATGLSAGTYTLNIVDNNGCTGSSSVTITQPNALGALANATSGVTCNGGSNGSASVTASAGTPAYTYTWYPSGGTNAAASGLSAGSYTVTVNDGCGAGATASVTITQVTAVMVSASPAANVLCNGGSDGSASSVTSGGTAPYTYAWTGGSTNSTATGLLAGTYTLTVHDNNGCTGSTTTTIIQPAALNIVKDSVADDGHCHGSAWVTVTGGVAPYNYLWSNGNTTYLDDKLCKGSYCCTVTDANGCKDSVCIKVKSTLGIDGITSDAGQLNVYPNPNNGQFSIESSVEGKSIVEIYNVLGEKVYTTTLSSTKGINIINMGTQSNGVYLYRVVAESGSLIGQGKLIIQK